MDSRRLAMELAARMQDIVPSGFTVIAEDDVLWFARNGTRWAGSYACQWLNGGQETPESLLLQASQLALHDLQDFLAEETTDPWPGSGGAPPRPSVRFGGRTIELWFGDHDRPDVRLRPLSLED